ncbi:hypothetical protein [Phenylobacterium sp.]|uniref:hypothetical protein n=1 Tax=Phenylobacterium sp. TaxID=1871053 RepID=UPI00261BB845|nr:hypothetical protein [Phenylobacterium sp.]
MSAKDLATWVDDLCRAGVATVSENNEITLVSGLPANVALELEERCKGLSWECVIEDQEGSDWTGGSAVEEYAPFRAIINKPAGRVDEKSFLTISGLSQALSSNPPIGVVRVASQTSSLTTWGTHFVPWEDASEFSPFPPTKDPRKFVRETSGQRSVVDDIRPWIIKDGFSYDLHDPVFQCWSAISSRNLLRSLSNEISDDSNSVIFSGPPRVILEVGSIEAISDLTQVGFDKLQSAASWVFELPRETEMRHALFSMEFARYAGSTPNTRSAVCEASDIALEGAKAAYHLGLIDLSRDTVKALSELRKMVSEDVARASDATRQLITSVAGALSVELAIVAAKISSDVEDWLLISIAVVSLLYVAMTVAFGHRHLSLQSSLRKEWRNRVYTFLSGHEYREMVQTPLANATRTFYYASGVGLLLSALIFVAVLAANGSP